MKPLDPLHIDLDKSTLIEASAGTGKTYTITTLFVRLIAMGRAVESILVVTFTEAAAAELKLRIRSRLSAVLDELNAQRKDLTADELTTFLNNQEDPSLISRRIEHAINCFDQSSVMTIHSFCMKVLKTHAFESGAVFDIELMPDRSRFFHEVCHDFFMSRVNHLDPLFLSYLHTRQITPERFMSDFGPVVSRSDLTVIPGVVEFSDIFDDYRSTLKNIHVVLKTGSQEIVDLLQHHDGIAKRSYSKRNVPTWLEKSCRQLDEKGMDSFVEMAEDKDPLFKFTQSRIREKTKQGFDPPIHELFDLCQQLLFFDSIFADNIISLKLHFLEYFKTALETLKTTHGVCFFDDLVNDLASVLTGNAAGALKHSIQQQYSACLIDEFQDTDPRQYDIFSTLFSTPHTPFFMIGDPKQAIYAFRGGDIFAYLTASAACEQQFTLKNNYRSAPLLINGINAIFSHTANPFIFNRIGFSPVTPADTVVDCFQQGEKKSAPLQFCYISRNDHPLDKKGFISKQNAANIIPETVAQDISLLLSSRKRLADRHGENSRAINPGDIAILVRTNEQAREIQEALSICSIPSYLLSTGSVFDAPQAKDLYGILWAVYHHDRLSNIRAVLCTPVFGFTENDIILLNQSAGEQRKWQEWFAGLKQLWESKGITAVLTSVFHHTDAFLSASTQLDDRALTNYYHLAELIARAGIHQQLSPYYLLKWYTAQLSPELRETYVDICGTDELRLETDQRSVAIVTIHKSKGLEYPIVYLPYLWEGKRKTTPEHLLFHDPEMDHRLTLDLQPDPHLVLDPDSEGDTSHGSSSISCFQREEKAEHRRLLYVALTRASAMCRIFWGGFHSVETSALGSLLYEMDHKGKNSRPQNKYPDPNAFETDDQMIRHLEYLQSKAPDCIAIEHFASERTNGLTIAPPEQHSDLTHRQLIRHIEAAWEISSFSKITRNDSHPQNNLTDKKESPSFPEAAISQVQADAGLITLSDFPKGTGSGELFHAIFETLNFTAASTDLESVVHHQFQQFGFMDPDLAPTAIDTVREILSTRLETPHAVFCLKEFAWDCRFNELAFLFPVQAFSLNTIINAFKYAGLEKRYPGYLAKLSSLSSQSFQGFIKGFIDLTIQYQGKWYIVDYKSNYLGDRYTDYNQDAMMGAMADHHYFLQYYIYTAALHRYLSFRIPDYNYDTHFGGVLYLFIRGMHPDTGSSYGVFYDRPEKSVIDDILINR